ncbi:MAG TPA: hypothetical protein VK509_18600, partial [Polyangiales bacterium]|nr:hypothetical protein [Polyangiales bacterium]
RNGSLICWGNKEWDGEVSGPNADSSTDFVQLMAAAYQTCGLHSDHSVTCWGDDSDEQVTGFNTAGAHDFVQISGSIEVDGNHLCGLHEDGSVSCWGSDTTRQVSGLQDILR